MLLSEIGDKEIVDISNGSMHGRLWDAEIIFDEKNGKIHSLCVPNFESKLGRSRDELHLPWPSIIIVGEDMIILRSRSDTSPHQI